MPVYPDIIAEVKSTTPLQWSNNFRVLTTQFENGQESRRLIDGYTRRRVKLSYSPARYEQANVLRRFYEKMQGPFRSFSFFFPHIEVFIQELTAICSSTVISIINLPSKDAQSYTLYRNGIALTEVSDYLFHSGTGPDGEDQADLLFYTSYGDVFTWSFTGRLRINAVFSSSIVFSDVKTLSSSITVELKALLPTEVIS